MSARYQIKVWGLWVLFGAGLAADAAEVKIFRSDSQEAVLEGALEGVSVDPLGAIEIARRLERLATIEEPFVFSAAPHPDGWVVGTGNSGKVLRVDRGGEITELHAAEEPEVFAVEVDRDGAVLAATSPDGKVYRIAGEQVEVIFEAEDRYIWDLARDAEGRLLVATGLAGRLYRIDGSGQPLVLYESRDSHVRAITVLPDGAILLGTAGQGLIVRIDPDGGVTTLHDAAHPEILAIVATPDGTAYAAALASEASFVDLSAKSSGTSQESSGEKSTDDSVAVVAEAAGTVGSRSASFSGPRSLVLEISPAGKAFEVASFQSETVHSLLFEDGDLWIGTGQEGKLYRWSERRLIHEAMLEERQVASLAAGPAGVAAVTANASAIYRLHGEAESAGTYTSAVLDAAQVSRFGSFLWQGSLPRRATVELAFRSGMSAEPDATWTAWAGGGTVRCTDCDNGSGRGQEVALGGVASGRYVQWRARLERGRADSPRLEGVELSYRQENLRPKIEKLEVLDSGKILVPSSFNPQNQTFEPWSPNREGIFTTLRLEAPKNGDGRLKELWKKGYRTLRWSAADDNGDELSYRLEFRREKTGDDWLSMVEETKETYYSFDATVLPDGIYRFRLTASDGEARSEAEALSHEKVSETVVIDHASPVLVAHQRRGSTIEVELRDALSPMRDAAVSVDAGEWRPARAVDGLLDGRRETLRLELPAEARLLLLRVSDAAHNVVTFDLLEE